MSNVAAESEGPLVAEPESVSTLKPAPGSSMLERWIEQDADRALKKIDALGKTLEHLRIASIRATYPSDWVIHTSLDVDGNIVSQRGYLQDIGADRAGKFWGIIVERPLVQREDFQDGTFVYRLLADAWSKVTGERVENVEGSRWSGDKFFQRGLQEGERVDPSDVSKAAYANLHGRAVRALAGLGGVPIEALKQAGLDTSRMVFVGYAKGAKGGESAGAGVGTAELTIRWGNAKGKKLSELSDKDLAYYTKQEEKNLENPEKEKFRANTQRMLDGLRAEAERRKKSTEQAAETGTEAPKDRGAKLGEALPRLKRALGPKNQRHMAAFLEAVTAKVGGTARTALSDVTDEELDQVLALTDEELAAIAAEVMKE